MASRSFLLYKKRNLLGQLFMKETQHTNLYSIIFDALLHEYVNTENK